jgi:hypothetical protein
MTQENLENVITENPQENLQEQINFASDKIAEVKKEVHKKIV